MGESFIYSLNVIAPIFILVLLGVILRKIKMINDEFLSVSDKLVFKICLPTLLFLDIVKSDMSESFDFKLIVFCSIAVTAVVIISCLIVPIFIKSNAKRGAFIQGTYRSNSAILGITLSSSMFGAVGETTIAAVLPFVVVFFNVYAVVILSMFAPADTKLTRSQMFKRIIKTIVTNPLIISIAIAILWKLVGLPTTLPTIMDNSLIYISNMATPLALISLGATIKVESMKGRIGLAILSSVCRTVIVPLSVVLIGVLIGLRGVSLGVVFVIFGGPAAVSSYIMAKQMKSDHELAAQILLISTVMSTFTMFLGIFILKATGLI